MVGRDSVRGPHKLQSGTARVQQLLELGGGPEVVDVDPPVFNEPELLF